MFTSYTKMADILSADIPGSGTEVPCRVIDGRTPVEDRFSQPAVDRFGRVGDRRRAGAESEGCRTGLNITAANHVIHYNLEWNPAVEDQATARAHRRGQTLPVTVHRLFHPGPSRMSSTNGCSVSEHSQHSAVVGTEGEGEDLADVMEPCIFHLC